MISPQRTDVLMDLQPAPRSSYYGLLIFILSDKPNPSLNSPRPLSAHASAFSDPRVPCRKTDTSISQDCLGSDSLNHITRLSWLRRVIECFDFDVVVQVLEKDQADDLLTKKSLSSWWSKVVEMRGMAVAMVLVGAVSLPEQ